jgi:hypothetical protein
MGGTLSQIGLLKLDAASVHLTKFELDRAISYWRLTLGSKAILNKTEFSKLFMRPVAKKKIRQDEEKRVQDMYELFCRYESHCRPLSPHCSHSNPSALVHCIFFVAVPHVKALLQCICSLDLLYFLLTVTQRTSCKVTFI